ncbi:MAG: hypothetical protein HYU98_08285, partial [Deltaproteobacteria bacterium]|nr:hypothetical protein [Deltaproteobacteria bacterium]
TTTGTTVAGTLYQPNGTDPLPGALLYIPRSATAAQIAASKTASSVEVGVDCESAPSNAAFSTCSGADGSFDLNITDCTDIDAANNQIVIYVSKGAFDFTITISGTCTSADQTIATEAADTTAPEITTSSADLKIAVCSSAWDRMEDVLGRMGLAPSDSDDDGTPNYNGWDGSVNANFNYFRGDYYADTDFPSCCALMSGDTVAITDSSGAAVNDSNGSPLSRSLTDYDIVFVNCGNGCEPSMGGLTSVLDDAFADFTSSNSTLRSYVNGGGALYITDLSYDFIEQAFPEYIDFLNGGNGANAETAQDAQHGIYGSGVFEPLASTVNQSVLTDYLSSVDAGNTDCGTPSGTGALNSDNTVNICHFLSSWAVMIGLESGSTATNWVQGAAEFNGSDTNVGGGTITPGTTEIPLTVSFSHGSGSVLYTSYHTNNAAEQTTDFLPQERILQFLILDLLGNL